MSPFIQQLIHYKGIEINLPIKHNRDERLRQATMECSFRTRLSLLAKVHKKSDGSVV